MQVFQAQLPQLGRTSHRVVAKAGEGASEGLFTPYKLGELELSNRIAMASLTRARAVSDHIPNDLMIQYYTQRASTGLILSEATNISEQGLGWVGTPGIYTQEMVEGWKKVTDSVHAAGSKMFCQLWHCGRASHTSFHPELGLPVAPSPIAIRESVSLSHAPIGKVPYEVPRPLETDEIPMVVADYKKAAENAKAAGFDGIEVHCANGYLIDQFLQSSSNQREDQYGGSLENRFRIMREVLEACMEVFPKSVIGVKLSPNGVYNDMGSKDYVESFTYYLTQLNSMDLGYVQVMDGLTFGFHELGEPFTIDKTRELFKGTIIANVGYDKEAGMRVTKSGSADLVAYGRPFLSNPDLVERFQNGWPLEDTAAKSVWYKGGANGYVDFPRHGDGLGKMKPVSVD